MTGTLILSCYGFAFVFLFEPNNECSVVEVVDYVDDDGNVHTKEIVVNNTNNNHDTPQDNSSTEEGNSDNNGDDVSSATSGDGNNNSNNNNSKNNSNSSNGISSEGSQSSSVDSSGVAEPNRRWIPERVETIKHPAETQNIKTCIVTCMCGAVFSAKSGPAAVAQYQAHRPVP